MVVATLNPAAAAAWAALLPAAAGGSAGEREGARCGHGAFLCCAAARLNVMGRSKRRGGEGPRPFAPRCRGVGSPESESACGAVPLADSNAIESGIRSAGRRKRSASAAPPASPCHCDERVKVALPGRPGTICQRPAGDCCAGVRPGRAGDALGCRRRRRPLLRHVI